MYCQLRDEVKYSFKRFDTKCYSCGSYKHYFLKCPLILFNPKRDNIISKAQFSAP
jgi:hypothetical protein